MTLRALVPVVLTLAALAAPASASVLVLSTDNTVCVQAVTGILAGSGQEVISANVPTLENPANLVSNGTPKYDAVVLPDGDYSTLLPSNEVATLISSLVQYADSGGRIVAVGRGAELLAEKMFPNLVRVVGHPSSAGTATINVSQGDPLLGGSTTTSLTVYVDQNTPIFQAPEAVATYSGSLTGDAVVRVFLNQGLVVLIGPHVHDQNGNPLDSDVILKNAVGESTVTGVSISVSGVQVSEDSQGVYIDLQGVSYGIPSGYSPEYAYLVLINEETGDVICEQLSMTQVIEGNVNVGPLNIGPGMYYALLEVVGIPSSGDDMIVAAYATEVKVPGYVEVKSVTASYGYDNAPILTVECTGTVIGDTITKIDVYLGTTQVGSYSVSLTGDFDWKETITLSSVPSPGTYTVLLKLTTASGKTVEVTTPVEISYGVEVEEFDPQYVFLTDEKETGVRFLCKFKVVNTKVTKITFYVDGTAVKTEDVSYGPGEYTIDETVAVQGLKYGPHDAKIEFTTWNGQTFSDEAQFEVSPTVMPTGAPAALGLLLFPVAGRRLRRTQSSA